jgi:hypothetical protein
VLVNVTTPLLPNEPLVAVPRLRLLIETLAAWFPVPVPVKTNVRFEELELVNSCREAE